jgi:hypothetical protein
MVILFLVRRGRWFVVVFLLWGWRGWFMIVLLMRRGRWSVIILLLGWRWWRGPPLRLLAIAWLLDRFGWVIHRLVIIFWHLIPARFIPIQAIIVLH